LRIEDNQWRTLFDLVHSFGRGRIPDGRVKKSTRRWYQDKVRSPFSVVRVAPVMETQVVASEVTLFSSSCLQGNATTVSQSQL